MVPTAVAAFREGNDTTGILSKQHICWGIAMYCSDSAAVRQQAQEAPSRHNWANRTSRFDVTFSSDESSAESSVTSRRRRYRTRTTRPRVKPLPTEKESPRYLNESLHSTSPPESDAAAEKVFITNMQEITIRCSPLTASDVSTLSRHADDESSIDDDLDSSACSTISTISPKHRNAFEKEMLL